MNSSANVVLELAKCILDKEYTLCLGNWYSSPKLHKELHKRRTNALGSIRCNRKFPDI
jgi:hypothetical protein